MKTQTDTQAKYPAFFRLDDGMSRFYAADGNLQCAGARMGRRDTFPADLAAPHKLRMRRICASWECYDETGAYWGMSNIGNHVYLVAGEDDQEQFQFFLRAIDRECAKAQILRKLPNATFRKS